MRVTAKWIDYPTDEWDDSICYRVAAIMFTVECASEKFGYLNTF